MLGKATRIAIGRAIGIAGNSEGGAPPIGIGYEYTHKKSHRNSY